MFELDFCVTRHPRSNTSYIKQMPRITMYMFVLRTPLGAREFPNFLDWYQIHLLFFILPFRRSSRTSNKLCLKCMPNCMACCFHCIFSLRLSHSQSNFKFNFATDESGLEALKAVV
jgi:hypothetical protein